MTTHPIHSHGIYHLILLGRRGMMVLWFVMSLILATYSVFLHVAFRSTSLDLALHSQLLWNLARGRFMTTSFMAHSFCANHFWPGLYLLVPFHEAFGTTGLLVLQAFVVAAGVFPVYALTLDVTKRKDGATALYATSCTLRSLSGFFLTSTPNFSPCRSCSDSYYAGRKQRYGINPGHGGCILLRGHSVGLLRHRCAALFQERNATTRLSAARFIFSIYCYRFLSPDARVPRRPECSAHGKMVAPGYFHAGLRQIWYLFFAVGLTPLSRLRYLLPAVPLVALLTWSNLNVQMDIRFGYIAPAVPFFFIAAAHGAKKTAYLATDMDVEHESIRPARRPFYGLLSFPLLPHKTTYSP